MPAAADVKKHCAARSNDILTGGVKLVLYLAYNLPLCRTFSLFCSSSANVPSCPLNHLRCTVTLA